MSDTETIDRLFLELSQFTKAETEKEIALRVERDEAIGARDHFRSEADRLHKCFGTIDRLRVDLAQEKRWGLEAHERAGGVEERLRTEVDDWKIQDRIHRQNAFDWQLTIGELKGRIEELEENIRTVVKDPYYLRFLGNALKEKNNADAT